jgi:hypothetical protein
VDITSAADSSDGRVCGLTDHFSPFAIVQLLDSEGPEITTPGPKTVEATSAAGATVTFEEPTASDTGSGLATLSCSHVSGVTFAIGTTTVTCMAEDTAGNEATATFTVTVNTTLTPTNKNQCKNGGWQQFNNPFFVDQGSCVSFAEKKKK